MANVYYEKDNNKKILKSIKILISKIMIFILLLIVILFISLITVNQRANEFKNKEIQMQQKILSESIKKYKLQNGLYPNLDGNENNLNNIKTLNKLTFDKVYGKNQLYFIPENNSKGIIKSNNVTPNNDKKGGWFYNIKTGEIKPNI